MKVSEETGYTEMGRWGDEGEGVEGVEEPVRCAGFPRCSNWRGVEGVEEPVRCAGFPRCSNWRGVEINYQLPTPNAQCPMPYPPCPITNS